MAEAVGEDGGLGGGVEAGFDEVAEVAGGGVHGLEGGVGDDGVELMFGFGEVVEDAVVGFDHLGEGWTIAELVGHECAAEHGAGDEVRGDGVPRGGFVVGDFAELGDGGIVVESVEVGSGDLVGAILF